MNHLPKLAWPTFALGVSVGDSLADPVQGPADVERLLDYLETLR